MDRIVGVMTYYTMFSHIKETHHMTNTNLLTFHGFLFNGVVVIVTFDHTYYMEPLYM